MAALATIIAGCGPDLLYLPSLAAGQLEVITHAVPIEEAIADETLTDRERGKLELIQDVRAYARDTMGLRAGASYTLFYDNRDGARVYNVSASRRDRFQAATWIFPVVGVVPYLGFFNQGQAERQADALRDAGLDVYMYEVDAYSTLAYVPNPVQSSMLRRDDLSLIETVIHELLHNTVWRAGDVTFNESLATFFGRTGTPAYLRDRFGGVPELIDAAVASYEDTDRYNAFIFDLFAELEAYYAGDAGAQAKIAGREAVYQAYRERFVSDVLPLMNVPENYVWVADLPTNNAWMLANRRYNLDLDLFRQVHEAAGEDWATSIDIFTAAAASEDPKAFLRDWLQAPSAAGATVAR